MYSVIGWCLESPWGFVKMISSLGWSRSSCESRCCSWSKCGYRVRSTFEHWQTSKIRVSSFPWIYRCHFYLALSNYLHRWDAVTGDSEKIDSYEGHYDVIYCIYDPKYLSRYVVYLKVWFSLVTHWSPCIF